MFAPSHELYAIFVKPEWLVNNKKAWGHMLANWIYCTCIVVPILTTSNAFKMDGIMVCGYKWPPMQYYYAMYFVFLWFVGFLGPFGEIAIWYQSVRRQSSADTEDLVIKLNDQPLSTRNDADVQHRCKAAITLFIVSLFRWVPFWMYHFKIIISLSGDDDKTRSLHVPGGQDPFQLAVTWATYLSVFVRFLQLYHLLHHDEEMAHGGYECDVFQIRRRRLVLA